MTDSTNSVPSFFSRMTRFLASGWGVVVAAVLVSSVYLPTLAMPFDLDDDGTSVYAEPSMPLGQRIEVGWKKVVTNYLDLGPFRPTLWLHWEVMAELFDRNPVPWRLSRWLWTTWSAAMLLWLMRELRIHPVAAFAATALAIWNPYRSEIWTSLTLSEGVAMPYAILALVCAVRANRSNRPWMWDLVGAGCVIMALGCKNTFVALIPAQILLRVAPMGANWRDGLRRHRIRAGLLALTLLLPIGHFIYFKLNWQPGQYTPGGPTWAQFTRIVQSLKGAMSIDFLGVGMLLAAIGLLVAYSHLGPIWRTHRGTLMAAGLLLVGGIGVYLPMAHMSGRYTMPAVWGMDLAFAVVLSSLVFIPRTMNKRVACGFLAAGLIAVAASNIGRQDRFAARLRMYWQAIEWVKRESPAGTRIAWVTEAGLATRHSLAPSVAAKPLILEEGVHFAMHVQRQGRADVNLEMVDVRGRRIERVEFPPLNGEPNLVFTSVPARPAFLAEKNEAWQMRQFRSTYWAGQREFACYMWMPAPEHAAK